VHGAIKLVGPRGVGEDPFDAEIEFGRGLFRADGPSEPADNFVASLGEVLGAVVKNLRAIMRSSFGPRLRRVGGLDGVA